MITNFTVGPAKLYTGVEDFLCKCIKEGYGEISHRSAKFTEISKQALQDFRKFFDVPGNYKIFYTYSATEGLELATKNCVNKNIAHISNGNFGNLWAKTSKQTGKTVQKFDLESENLKHGERVDLEKIFPEISKKNLETEMICLTANETAAGVAYSPQEIFTFSQKLKNSKYFADTLLGVDITSGIGGYAYDFASADIWAFSVQKALGLPAGLGLLIVSPRAYEKSIQLEEEKKDVGAHHSFSGLEKKMKDKFQTPTTPNFFGILGLGYISRTFLKDFGSMKNLEKITTDKAQDLYNFLENSQCFKPRVSDINARSKTIIIAKKRNDSEKFLAEKLNKLQESGMQIGKGYGPYKLQEFRIGNFPVHTKNDIENLIQNLD